MKKKKSQKPSPSSTAAPALAPTDFKALIREHSLFFDRLVDLVPARFYLPAPDADDRPWIPGLSKQARACVRKQSRENTKKSRRARLDPDRSSSTIDLLKRRVEADNSGAPAPAPAEAENAGEEGEDAPAAGAADDRPVTYEELRERLHRRIEELRSNRNTRPSGKPKNDSGDKRKGKGKGKEKKGDSGLGKRKREEKSEEEAVEKNKKKQKKKKEKKPAEGKERDASTVELSFGQVKIGDTDDEMGKKKKKKLSKLQSLNKAKRLEEAKKDPEKGEGVSRKHSWKAAVSRAAGVKVHDDPKLLKESIKKGKKRHQKNVEKWKERIETTEKSRAEKQKTRADNIKERIHQKKMRKIEKREKKLMRPGFEGRKEGYINDA